MRKKDNADHPELGLPDVRPLWEFSGLFSDNYLKARVAQNAWWPKDDEVRSLWEFCRDLYTKRYTACARNNEAFTRQELLNKILEKLGFPWSDNLGLPESKQDLEPDYILYPDADTKERVLDKSAAERYRAAITLLEAKKVNHPLSQISRHQQRYPHQQVRQYLDEAQVLSWGILTNGNEWRLYCRDAKPSQYFALNFGEAIRSLENFKYFAVLFAPAAFARDAQGKCRLDQVRESAVAAQWELEEDLRQRVFTLVEVLAKGFAERAENNIPDTPEGHRLVYESCLIFLYRLLFILYAEGRGLLPVEPKGRKYYKELSLARLVGQLKDSSGYDSQTRTRLYEDIVELCHLINGTDERKNKEYSVPRYNGGLFDPEHYGHLDRWRICDATLADVLRDLMFAKKPDRSKRELALQTVDYADLRVQQLGSIYEGLLEHHLVRENGRLILKTDKGERKATGTYYTPDYIVKYIVDNTLGPLLRQIEESEPVKAAKAAGERDNTFADTALRLNILDPAMGSGHFLVEVTVYLADQIVAHPTTRFLTSEKRGEPKEQEEMAHWRRRVVETCVYGVDLNPLAVELAKLSLWLTTISSDQPLNFLDHHLRCGNSLIGARLDDLGKLPQRKKRRARSASVPQQITFTFGPDLKKAVSDAISEIRRIEEKASGDVDAVKDKEKRWLERVLPVLAPYKAVADLWTSAFFGNEMDEETYVAHARKMLDVKASGGHRRRSGTVATKLSAIAATRHSFHWELEFPEVFFNDDGTPRENPGFNAVIGNPPYLLLQPQNVDANSLAYYQSFPVAQYKIDIYHLFINRGIDLLADAGHIGYITPAPFLMNNYTVKLRRYILDTCAVTQLVVIPDGVFPEASVDNVVSVLTRSRDSTRRTKNRVRHTVVAAYVQPAGGDWHETQQESIAASRDALFLLRATPSPSPSVDAIPLKEIASVNFGMQLRDRSKFPSDVVRTKDRSQLTRYHEPCWDGGAVSRYALTFNDLYAYVNEEARRGGCWDMAIHRAPKKIIIRQIGSFPICALDTTRNVCLNAVFMAVAQRSNYSLHYILALLNSQYMANYWLQTFSDRKRTFPKIKGTYLLQLPMRRIAFKTAPAERKRLGQRSKELYEAGLAKGDAEGVLEFAGQQLAADRTDVIHDLLAFLAERMTALNKQKHAAARGFLTDLKDFHGVDAHSLKPKTKLDEFWTLEVTDLFAHLKANVRLLAAQDIRLKESDDNKIRSRFQKAKEKIIPLESALAFTDHLIDQIVYRLYGLTEEEIRIVEEER